jgi:hypothetical protein
MHRCSVPRYLRVNRVYISRLLVITAYAKETYNLTTALRRCSGTEHSWCSISQYHARRQWTVMEKTVEQHTPSYSMKVACCMMPQNATSLTTRVGRFRSYMEWRKRNSLRQNFYVSVKNSILSNHGTQQLEEIIPTDNRALDEMRSQVTAPRQTLDVDCLHRAHHSFSLREKQTHYHLLILTVDCTVTIIGILCLLLRSYLRSALC